MKYRELVKAIAQIHAQAQTGAAAAVNRLLVLRNWIIGAQLIEFEQAGEDRASYGENLLPRLEADLTKRGLTGCSREMLGRMRLFYRAYPELHAAIRSSPMTKLSELSSIRALEIRSSPMTESARAKNSASPLRKSRIRQSPFAELAALSVPTTPSRKSADADSFPTPLTPEQILRLSWTHLIELLRLDDPWRRAFYENECLLGGWSVRQLQRQIGSQLYERTGLSKNKCAVVARARAQAKDAPLLVEDLIRDPYVLEFTGLAERPAYSENQLETALLDHVQHFLLELGTGFCFEARQFRITAGNEHDRIDLVFYHRRLRCHVLVDLKIRAFSHADAGQMNFYLNYFKQHMRADGDQPPVGILLCSAKDETKVEYATAGLSQKLFVSRYLVALPSVAKLKRFVEADRARLERR